MKGGGAGGDAAGRTCLWRVLLDPTCWVMSAVLLGAACGLLVQRLGWGAGETVQVLGFPGVLWLKALKCIVLPMIVLSMIQSMVMLKSLPGARTIGLVVVGLYSCTTLCAAILGIVVSVLVMRPLLGDISHLHMGGMEAPDLASFTALESVLNIFNGLVPKNLVSDAAENNLLPIIVASIIFGLLINDKRIDGTPSMTLVVVSEVNDVVVKVVTFVMALTPLGVGSLVFAAIATQNFEETGRVVGMFMLSVLIGLALHFCVVYPTLVACFSGRNPAKYVINIAPALFTAFGTSSSAAALPVTQRCSIEKNGISQSIARFVLSLGATINMDGTGLYLICAGFFLGTLEGVEFDFGKFCTMAVLAMLCSLGTAPVPSASLVLLATIMTSVGIPITSKFGYVYAVDWLLDRLRTVVNVCGDAAVTAVIDRFYGNGCGCGGDGLGFSDGESRSDASNV